MASVFDGMFSLAAAPLLRQTFSVLVTLRRAGESDTENVKAQPRKPPREIQEEDNPEAQQIEHRNYFIDAADYAFGGSPVEPREGDRVIETINGTSCTFEVLPNVA